MKRIFAYTGKLSLCGLGFFISMTLSSIVLPVAGFWLQDLPAGRDEMAIALSYFLGSMLLAFVLSLISRNLSTSWLARWIILAEVAWVCGVSGMAVKSFLFTTNGPVLTLINALFTLLIFLLPSLFLSGLVTLLFRPAPLHELPQRTSTPSRKADNIYSRPATALRS